METFANTPKSGSRSALRSHARKLGSPRGGIGAFVVLAIVASAAASAGAFGTFTSQASDTHSVTAGTVVIGLGASGPANRFSVAADHVAAGDTIERVVDLNNTGNLDLASVTLTTTAPVTSSALDTDAIDGLQMKIDDCSAPWTEAGVSPQYTYTCDGPATQSVVLAHQAVLGSTLALSNLASLTAGASDHLLVTLDLPSTADNTFQGLHSVINYQFDATQRTSTNR